MEKKTYQAPVCAAATMMMLQNLTVESMNVSSTKVTEDIQVYSNENNSFWDDED